MTDGRIGVVAMAYGTPARPEDVEAYYTHIRRGRPPEPEQLADLQRRYDALGVAVGASTDTAAGTDVAASDVADLVDAHNAVLDQLRVVSTERLAARLGMIAPDQMRDIDQALRFVLDL